VLPTEAFALISAAKGWGMGELLDRIAHHLWGQIRHANCRS